MFPDTSVEEEEIPQYKLRTLSASTENIIQTPVLDPRLGEGLTYDQAKGVLDYFLSCGDLECQISGLPTLFLSN